VGWRCDLESGRRDDLVELGPDEALVSEHQLEELLLERPRRGDHVAHLDPPVRR
jgi:hypothetical protein